MADAIIGSITLFYLFIMLLSVVFAYLFRFDVWLQGILIIVFIFTFAVFVPHIYQNFQLEQDIPADRFIIPLDSVDINDYTITDQEVIDSSDIFHVFTFSNIPEFKEGRFNANKLCFLYNNSDVGDNIVQITNGVQVIGDNVYIRGETTGVKCQHFNTNITFKDTLFGVNCADCSVPNPLAFPKVDGNEIEEIHIEKSDLTNFNISLSDPHMFYIAGRDAPEDTIKETWNTYMMLLGFLILIFIMRLLVVFIETFRRIVQ